MAQPVSYHNRTFRSVNSSANGEVSTDTVFHYQQTDEVVMATYSGGAIRHGMLLARADCFGHLDARYQHLNQDGKLLTGTCQTVPEVLPDGRLRLYETWQWTSGDFSRGESILEEIE